MAGLQRGPGQAGEQVEAQLVQAAVVAGAAGVAGGGIGGHPQRDDVFGRSVQRHGRRAVVAAGRTGLGPADAAAVSGLPAAVFGAGRVRGDDLAAQPLVQDPPGPALGHGQDGRLHPVAQVGVGQAAGALGDQPRLVRVDTARLERFEGVREFLEQLDRQRDLSGRPARRPARGQGHLVAGSLDRPMHVPRSQVVRGVAALVFRAGRQLGEHPQLRRFLVRQLSLPRHRHHDQLVRGQRRRVHGRQRDAQFWPGPDHRQPIDRFAHA
nr:hypothetical protein [Jiangella alkaliphila]